MFLTASKACIFSSDELGGTFFCGFALKHQSLDVREMQGHDGSCWDEGGMGIFTDIHEYGTIKINGIHGSRYIYPWIPNGSVMENLMPYLQASFAKQRLSWIPYTFKALVPPDLAAHAAARGQCRIGRRTSPEF